MSKKCCVPNCSMTRGDDTILHIFPNPEKDLDRFMLWTNAVGGHILSLDNKAVFECRRICHLHFEPQFYTRSRRLSPSAIPTLHLQDRINRQKTQIPTSAKMECKIESEDPLSIPCEKHIKTEDTNSEHSYQSSVNIGFEEIHIKPENEDSFQADYDMNETDNEDTSIQQTDHKIKIENLDQGKVNKPVLLDMPGTSSPVKETTSRSMDENSRLRRHVTYKQMDALWGFLGSNRDLATGYNKTVHARENSKRMWECVAESLNSQGVGAYKDWKGWSSYWIDYKAKLKKRVAAERQSQSRAGVGPYMSTLNDLDIRFLSLLGDNFGGGLLNQVNLLPNLTQTSTNSVEAPPDSNLQETKLIDEKTQPQQLQETQPQRLQKPQPQQLQKPQPQQLQTPQSSQEERVQTYRHIRRPRRAQHSPEETQRKLYDLRKYRISLLEKQTEEMHEQTMEMRKQRGIMQQMLYTLNEIANKMVGTPEAGNGMSDS